METAEIVVDARGHHCPIPTLRLRKALETAGPGARVRLLADDPMARVDVPHFLREKGYALLEKDEVSGWLIFVVARAE